MRDTRQQPARRQDSAPDHRPEVLVGVDAGPGAEATVRWAAREAAARQARLVITTVDHWAGDTCPTSAERTRTQARLLALAGAAQDEAPTVPVTTEVLEGLPGPALVTRAARAHLLVLGRPSPSARPSSPASWCSDHAGCPVVVVPLPQVAAPR